MERKDSNKHQEKGLSEHDKSRLSKVLKILKDSQIRFPVAEVAKRTGFNKGHVSGLLKGVIPISDNFYQSFIEHFCGDEKERVAEEPEASYGSPDQAILLLSESNRRLSEIIIKQTDVHYEEAKTNRILAEVNSTIVSKMPNSLIPSRALQDFSSQLARVIEQMALRGIPDQWKTFEEGREILDRLLSFEHQGKKSKDTDSGVGKGHK
jgi:hypothetical protein